MVPRSDSDLYHWQQPGLGRGRVRQDLNHLLSPLPACVRSVARHATSLTLGACWVVARPMAFVVCTIIKPKLGLSRSLSARRVAFWQGSDFFDNEPQSHRAICQTN